MAAGEAPDPFKTIPCMFVVSIACGIVQIDLKRVTGSSKENLKRFTGSPSHPHRGCHNGPEGARGPVVWHWPSKRKRLRQQILAFYMFGYMYMFL